MRVAGVRTPSQWLAVRGACRAWPLLWCLLGGCPPAPSAPPPTTSVVDDEHTAPTGPSTVIRGVIRRSKERDLRERRTRALELERALQNLDGGLPRGAQR